MSDEKGLVQSESINNTSGRHIRNVSTFKDLSYRKSHTERFGEYTPTFEMEGVPMDRSVSVLSRDLIDSLSLNAPFKGSIRKVKESFKVPNDAILPKNWDLIYTQPSNGDDVPWDANCVLENFPECNAAFWQMIYDVISSKCSSITSSDTLNDVGERLLTLILRCLVLGEFVYSNGCLLNVVGYKYGSGSWSWSKILPDGSESLDPISYDRWFDAVINLIFTNVRSFTLIEPVGSSYQTFSVRGLSNDFPSTNVGAFYNAFRFALEKFRENPACRITDVVVSSSTSSSSFMTVLKNLSGESGYGLFEADKSVIVFPDFNSTDPEDFTDRNPHNLNLSRLLAYQLVCAHFYTNSSIDIVYTAELFRSYIYALYCANSSTPSNTTHRVFTWNGMLKEYDVLSENILARALYLQRNTTNYNVAAVVSFDFDDMTKTTESMYNSFVARLSCYAAVFGFRKSLRFGDYFVGSRPRPLAPFNTDVAVSVDQTVSVIDVTRKIQAQRFANAVMRSRQKIEEYVQDLFGGRPSPDYHNPFFLSREEEFLFGDEVQNTAESQVSSPNSRTANFASHGGRYTFTFDAKDAHSCIYLQIVSYDVKRSYTRSVDRQFLVLDRYDMFNPDFQYIGDQSIYGIELGYPYGSSIPQRFAYTSRDMEYKQRFDVASGGFVENLPGWIVTDRLRDHMQVARLTPDFIRTFSSEFDQFYLSLTGYSLGSYFHLAVITDNEVTAVRPMAVDPQILQ